jgi:hypothetical protein
MQKIAEIEAEVRVSCMLRCILRAVVLGSDGRVVIFHENVRADQPHAEEQSHGKAHWFAQSEACQVENGTSHAFQGNDSFVTTTPRGSWCEIGRQVGLGTEDRRDFAVCRARVAVLRKGLTFPR